MRSTFQLRSLHSAHGLRPNEACEPRNPRKRQERELSAFAIAIESEHEPKQGGGAAESSSTRLIKTPSVLLVQHKPRGFPVVRPQKKGTREISGVVLYVYAAHFLSVRPHFAYTVDTHLLQIVHKFIQTVRMLFAFCLYINSESS